jgi:hypothetical protein
VNVYLDYAESVITAPVKRRMHAAEKRARTRAQRARDKELQERDELFALWKSHHKAQHDALLAGPHGTTAQDLIAFMQAMTLDDGEALLERVTAGSWRSTDADTRFTVLQLIDSALIRLRERNGLAPINDSIPFGDEPDTTFQVIREVLAP